MGWLVRSSVGFAALVVLVSVAGWRWNARGSVFGPEVAVDYSHDGKDALAVVTGGNAGLGFEVARGLALMRYRVLIGVRDVAKGKQAIKRIEAEEGEEVAQRLSMEEIDQTSLESVRQFADTVRGPVKLLVLNAGIFINQEPIAIPLPDGIVAQVSKTALVNHYAGFLLSNLLLPQLQASGGGRIVVISSGLVAKSVNFRGDPYLMNPALLEGDGVALYATSKLMNVLHARALAKRAPNVQINAVHPGIFKTELHRSENEKPATLIRWVLFRLFYGLCGLSPTESAASTLWVATANHSHTGEYFHGRVARSPPSPLGKDDELSEWLWRESEMLTDSTATVKV